MFIRTVVFDLHILHTVEQTVCVIHCGTDCSHGGSDCLWYTQLDCRSDFSHRGTDCLCYTLWDRLFTLWDRLFVLYTVGRTVWGGAYAVVCIPGPEPDPGTTPGMRGTKAVMITGAAVVDVPLLLSGNGVMYTCTSTWRWGHVPMAWRGETKTCQRQRSHSASALWGSAFTPPPPHAR